MGLRRKTIKVWKDLAFNPVDIGFLCGIGIGLDANSISKLASCFLGLGETVYDKRIFYQRFRIKNQIESQYQAQFTYNK